MSELPQTPGAKDEDRKHARWLSAWLNGTGSADDNEVEYVLPEIIAYRQTAVASSQAECAKLRAQLTAAQAKGSCTEWECLALRQRVKELEEALTGLLEGGKKFRANERSCGLIVYVDDEDKARAALSRSRPN